MKAITIISLLTLGICLLGAVSVTACKEPNILEVTHNYNIDAGEKRVISIVLERNDRLDLTITVIGNDSGSTSTPALGGDIGIQVNDPSGQAAVPFTRVESGNFIVLAEEDGVYVVTLDNSYSIFTPKSVTLVMRYPER